MEAIIIFKGQGKSKLKLEDFGFFKEQIRKCTSNSIKNKEGVVIRKKSGINKADKGMLPVRGLIRRKKFRGAVELNFRTFAYMINPRTYSMLEGLQRATIHGFVLIEFRTLYLFNKFAEESFVDLDGHNLMYRFDIPDCHFYEPNCGDILEKLDEIKFCQSIEGEINRLLDSPTLNDRVSISLKWDRTTLTND